MDLDPNTTILVGLLIWMGAFAIIPIFRRALGLPGIGLDLGYLVGLFLGHAPGAFLYLLPWYFVAYDGFAVAAGFELTWIGVVAFTVALLVGLLMFRPREAAPTPDTSLLDDSRLPWLLFGLGLFSYLVLQPLGGRIASLASVIANLTSLQAFGIVVGVWQGLRTKNTAKVLLWLALTPLLPFLTITLGGFLGFGLGSVVTVALFLFTRIRPRAWHIPVILLVIFFGVSLYITYIDGRDEIREVVWSDSAYRERVDVVNDAFSRWQWFDWRNRDHLKLIDMRLNQNFFVGVARMNLESGFVPYANGESLQRAAIGFIPRALWPNKPVMAGGSEFISRYTLMEFAEGSSFASGQVMELYVNFGMAGIILGFGAFGLIFAWVDTRAAWYLDGHHLYGFLRWFLIGIALTKPIDELTYVTAGTASALVTALLLEVGLKWWFARFGQKEDAPAPLPAASALLPRR